MVFWILLGITVIIAVLVGRAMGGYYRYRDWADTIGGFLMTMLIGGIVSLVVGVLALQIWGEDVPVKHKSYLKALGTDEQLKGSFFLASGSFSEDSTYKFIKVTSDGGFYMDEVGIRHAVVFEENEDKPYMVTVEHWDSNPWIVPWSEGRGNTYEFHVPANSVVESYKVDVND